MADSIDFQMMDNWLSKFGVSLINITRQNAGSSSNLIQMLQGGGNPASRGESVICISTDDVHYNWVLFKYRSRSTVESEVVINRDLLITLLAAGDPQVQAQQHSKAVSFTSSTASRSSLSRIRGNSQSGGGKKFLALK